MHNCSIYTTDLRIKVSLNLSYTPLLGSRRTKPDNAYVSLLIHEAVYWISFTNMQTRLDGDHSGLTF
jgi:hypothetical protein